MLAPTAGGDQALDHCLGCRRCEVVCPAGLAYGPILGMARTQQRQRRGANLHQAVAEMLATHPMLRAAALALYR